MRFPLLNPAIAAAASLVLVASLPALGAGASSEVLHPGAVHIAGVKGGKPHGGGGSNNLTYHGGVGGVGVEAGAGPQVYLVYWGSQWASDPSGEATIQQKFFSGIGGSQWNNSVTQYCQGVPSGTTTCGLSGTHATNPASVLAGTWYDNAAAAPGRPSQSQLASEAIKAAAYFGNTTAFSNQTVQYVINTATGNNASGFGSQYCAWHSSTSSGYGNIAYTNFPYITDAGATCGAGFVNGGVSTDGITIVGGHEFAETETDIFPNGGWLDGSGKENGDKCAWVSSGTGASANITLSTGTFAVQTLWSNAANNNTGGCVLS
jgi:serine protease